MTAPPASAAATDALDVSFSGSLVGTSSYTAATGEVMHGSLHAVTGREQQVAGKGVLLGGGTQGIQFTPSEWTLGSGQLTQGFLAEIAFTPTATQADMDTVFSAGGNLSVRSQAGQLRYGFDAQSPTDGTWSSHFQAVASPAVNQQHVLSLQYLPGTGSTTLHVTLDGTELPTVTSTVPATINPAAAAAFGFGNDVHPQGLDRGFVGSIAKARIAQASAPYSAAAYEFQPRPLTTNLLNVGYGGTLSGSGSYTAASGETLSGTLTARGAGVSIGQAGAQLQGGTQGLDFTAATPVFSGASLTQAFVMEAEFTPATNQANLGTLLAVGGNLFVRYQDGKLRYGFSAQANGTWHDYVNDVAAPAAGQTHTISLAYVPASGSTVMTVWLDGTALPEVSGPDPSTPNPQASETLAIGNELSVQDGSRGFSGTIEKTRFALLNDAFAPAAFVYQQLNAQNCAPVALDPSNYVSVTPGDCAADILQKSTLVRPTENQLNWQELRLTAFVHFGINTFYNQEWGYGTEDPAKFNPTGDPDPDTWVRELRDAGFRQAILVVKHHDGFVLYQSRYTKFGVMSSPWENGKGDVLKDFTEAAHKYGMKVGVYLSPADSHEEVLGVYGNGSAAVDHTIPTLVPGDNRAGKDIPTFHFTVDDYNAYFLNQLYEVLTQYGPINEVWFDGAEGNTTKTEIHDYAAYYDLIHHLQPNALIAVGGRDIRWVGNENGVARDNEWGPQAISNPADGGLISTVADAGDPDLGSDTSLVSSVQGGGANDLHWWPAEADMKLTSGWFAHPGDTPKSGSTLLNSYEVSTGHNGQMLLNVPPTTTGLFAPASVASIDDFAALRRETFTKDVALGVPATVDGTRTDAITDGNDRTSWASANADPDTVEINLPAAQTVNTVTLSEDVAAHGQSIDGFSVQAKVNGAWQTIATGGTIGVYRALPLSAPVTASQFRVNITKARGAYSLATVSLYQTLSSDPGPMQQVYLDCSAPTAGNGLSSDHPFNSLEQFRQAEIASGATVHIKSGTTCAPSDTPFWGYGTSTKPITVTTYDGQTMPTVGDQPISTLFTPLEQQGWKVDLPQPHQSTPSLSLSSSTVAAGGTVTARVSGFAPGTAVELTLHSTPVSIGTITTDTSGTGSAKVVIPATTVPGAHTVAANQGDSSAEAPLTVTAGGKGGSGTPGGGEAGGPGGAHSGAAPGAGPAHIKSPANSAGSLATTGSDAEPMLAIGALLLLAGAALLRRRRARRS